MWYLQVPPLPVLKRWFNNDGPPFTQAESDEGFARYRKLAWETENIRLGWPCHEKLTLLEDLPRRHTALSTCESDPFHPHFNSHKIDTCLGMESASGAAILQTVFAAFTAGNIRPTRLNIKIALPLCA